MQTGAVPVRQRVRRKMSKRKGPVGELQLRLEGLRDELGVTDVEFAGHLGVTRQHWFRMRQGTGRAGPDLLGRLVQMRPDWAAVIAGELARR